MQSLKSVLGTSLIQEKKPLLWADVWLFGISLRFTCVS